MVEVSLTQGKVALIDDEDAGRVLTHKWYAMWSERPRRWYAYHYCKRGDKNHKIAMHRFILNAPDDRQVDHVNQNGLDNRRSNLRLASHSQNQCNKGRQRNNKSGFKGVQWYKRRKTFRAQIQRDGKLYHLGYFTTAEAAALVYDAAAMLLHGEFARFNFPEESEFIRRVLERVQPAAA